MGADGIAHCDHAGTVTIVDSAPVSASALTDGVLATAAPTHPVTSSSLMLRTLSKGVYATVGVPADIESVSPGDGGFLLFMRTGAQGRIVAQNQRGPWCARVRLDGALELGTAWPRPFWNSGDTTLVDVGAPLAVGRSEMRGQLLDEELCPIVSVPFTSAFPPWTTESGTWLVMRSRALAYQLQDPAFAAGYDGTDEQFTYFRPDRAITRPETWVIAPGFPISLATLPSFDQVWVSTTSGTFATAHGALTHSGALALHDVDAELPAIPELPVSPLLKLGDPDEWTERQRVRLLAENTPQGLLDIEIDGWFPTTTLIVTFRVAGLSGRVCARRMSVFDRDGRPRLWQGAPSLMESILLDIDESGGVRRLQKKEPGPFGWVWV
ncbi:hypothetical protein C8E05_4146 [Rhodococcus wratislaviensis]|uniref:Uncharacterized protein n=3 Tax=Rhodococcus wratislaviensis TaxID=44752 RepID=A0AB38FK71_RHOWR|nr:hypothetical protein [Rhodococcus wratislaviensis]REE74702.1 hypothetical protein C8E05_4146 [Rhodococcus wratislaviensis]GAF49340.1 hypothetical protein RW1_077_00050 [Rhodococcus wratislaviensis NBRC 100605]SPZ41755.1 Uncharacterised protein [Rhodococcus wratislaviensis]